LPNLPSLVVPTSHFSAESLMLQFRSAAALVSKFSTRRDLCHSGRASRGPFARVAPALSCLACLVFSGCGQGEYEARMKTTENRVRQAAKFSMLDLTPRPIPNTNFLIRLPTAFAPPKGFYYTLESVDPFGSAGNISPDIMQPPFVKLPGIQAIMQSTAADDRGPQYPQYPWFCYLAAITDADWQTESVRLEAEAARDKMGAEGEKKPDGEHKAEGEAKPESDVKPSDEAKNAEPSPTADVPKADQNAPAGSEPAKADGAQTITVKAVPLTDYLVQKLSKAFPDKTFAWEEVQAEMPQGSATKSWKRLSLETEQPFQFIGSASNDSLSKVPGKFELYLYQLDGWNILVGWRAASAIDSKVPLARLAQLAAGTIQP